MAPVTVHMVMGDSPGGPVSSQRLATLLSRADRSDAPADSERLLGGLLGIVEPGRVPLGALMRLGDSGVPDADHWMLATPVTLVAHRNQVELAGVVEDLDLQQRNAIRDLVASHFGEADWQLGPWTGGGWLLGSKQPAQFNQPSPWQWVGRDISLVPLDGRDGARWRAVVTEIQMLLHECTVNRDRLLAGKPPVTGLWLWGSGGLGSMPRQRWGAIWGPGLLARGLAIQSGCPHQPGPAAGLAGIPATTVDPVLALAMDGQGRALAPDQLERHWLAPLQSALGARRIGHLVLYPGNGARYDLTPGRPWYWLLCKSNKNNK